MTTTKKKEEVRYDKNPFIDGMVVPVAGKQVKLSKLGKDNNILINQGTGEVHGTHVTTYKRVDAEQFVKLFTANIALTFDLKSAGIKAFNVLLWSVQYKAVEKDIVLLDKYALDSFLEKHELNLSIATFQRGLSELESSQIIAKAIRKGWYYINPNFCFNGDRVAFTTLIEREPEEESDTKALSEETTEKE